MTFPAFAGLPAGRTGLPVDALLPDILDSLERIPGLVLQAPPGAGKTSRVPLALLSASWLGGQRIVMLEPRRIAARAAAFRLAESLGEEVGGQVGYHVRHDRKVGPDCRIEVVTEGILTRRLQADPELAGVGAILFDEIHERSLQGDLGLALALEVQGALRDDLRLIAMSATLEGDKLAALMGNVPILTSEGRSFPVEIRYEPPQRPEEPLFRRLDAVASLICRILSEQAEGGLLVFLPGEGEIRRLSGLLDSELSKHPALQAATVLHSLSGSMPLLRQAEAIRPDGQGRRKIVLATPVAETSLTLDAISIIVDCGLMRAPAFDPASGMSRLETLRVTRANAEQRAGRAGRQGPGICYRLWSEAEQRGLLPHPAPEIMTADLAPLALELALWGSEDGQGLAWIDAPPAASLGQARDLLQRLGALDSQGRPGPHGQAMARFPLHPRLAHMVLTARHAGPQALETACHLAALLDERDLQRDGGGDIGAALALLQGGSRNREAAFRRVQDSARQIRKQAEKGPVPRQTLPDAGPDPLPGELLALAFPDRIAQKRGVDSGNRSQQDPDILYRLSGGRGARLRGGSPLAREDWLVVAELDGAGRDALIRRAAMVRQAGLESLFASDIVEEDLVDWDRREKRVRQRRVRRLGNCLLKEQPLKAADPDAVAAAMLAGIRDLGLHCLPWERDSLRLRHRLAFLAARPAGDAGGFDWPDMSDQALLDRLEDWLGPFLGGISRADRLGQIDLCEAMLSPLDYQQRQALDRLAPASLGVPSGSRIGLDYEAEDGPALEVRLQEMFGQAETPAILDGRHPVLLRLLSPARRPVQVTRDLAGFWAGSWQAVKAELKGRYPRHFWPDDPLAAPATRRAKRKGEGD